jgi:hypothetical protein
MPFSIMLREDILPQYSPDKLQKILRLIPSQLDRLVELIQNSGHFKPKDPARPQAPVKTQPLVALYRLGTKELSTHKVAFTMGVGQGSVNLYTCSVSLQSRGYKPSSSSGQTQAKKVALSSSFKREKGYPNAIGAADSVPLPFESAPQDDTASWNTRKFVHAMGCTAVCDHQGRFTYVSTGYVGSTHDSLDTYL